MFLQKLFHIHQQTRYLHKREYHFPHYKKLCGHIAFYNEENDILFCGDTLFAGGCGRVFEGTFDQMFESLNKLKQLPDSTQIYCGHEYTKSNLLFSVEVEPKNNDLIMRNTEIDNLLTEHGSSLPSSIGPNGGGK